MCGDEPQGLPLVPSTRLHTTRYCGQVSLYCNFSATQNLSHRRLINIYPYQQILQKFLQCQCDFNKLAEVYKKKNRTLPQLTSFIKNKFRELVLEMQYQLCRMKYISQLKIYDHASNQLFDQLIRMDRYFPDKLVTDFIFEEKSKYLCLEKSSSRKKMEMYGYFLQYAEEKKLLNMAVKKEDLATESGPFENPDRVFLPDQQELVCLLYEAYQGDYKEIGKKLREMNYTQPRFQGEKLYENLENLQNIGLYRCYRRSVKSLGGKGLRWEEFVKEQHIFRFPKEDWEQNIKVLLLRIAVRDDVSTQHIRNVCWYMNRRYDDKPLVQIPKGYRRPNEVNRVSTPELNKLRADLLSVLHNKIWFNEVNLAM